MSEANTYTIPTALASALTDAARATCAMYSLGPQHALARAVRDLDAECARQDARRQDAAGGELNGPVLAPEHVETLRVLAADKRSLFPCEVRAIRAALRALGVE